MSPAVRRLAALTALLLLFLPVLSGCSRPTGRGKTFYLPLSAEPRQLDPQVSTDAASVTMAAALFEGLTRLDETGKAVPGAAEWTVSGDGMTYTFRLRDSRWSDGTPVTAHDFVFGMQRSVMPSTRSSLAKQLFCIRGAEQINSGRGKPESLAVRAADDKTLRITLTEPDPSFPEKAASTPFMPCCRAFFEKTDGRYGLDTEFVLSNGPFALRRWNHSRSLILVKNEGYHGSGEIYPASVVYSVNPALEPVSALADRRIDVMEIPAEQAEQAKKQGIKTTALHDTVRAVWFNTGVHALSTPLIRGALRDGIEWPLINRQFRGTHCSPAEGYVPPDALLTGAVPYRNADNARPSVLQVEKAQNRLSRGLEYLKLKSMPKLTVLCADDPFSRQLALLVMQSWQKNLFVYFDIAYLSPQQLTDRLHSGSYQIAIVTAPTPGMSALEALSCFRSGAGDNYARFSSRAFDSMYEKSAAGEATRSEIDALELLLTNACPCIPLCFEDRLFGINPDVSGLIVRPFGGGAFGAPFDFRRAEKNEK